MKGDDHSFSLLPANTKTAAYLFGKYAQSIERIRSDKKIHITVYCLVRDKLGMSEQSEHQRADFTVFFVAAK